MASRRRKLEDCYYFFYGSCEKAEKCNFRHEVSALGTEAICFKWTQGRCDNYNCPRRHTKTALKNRAKIACFYEDQPSGCRKPHCVFLHKKDRTEILDDLKNSPGTLILPLSPKKTSNYKEKQEILAMTKKLMNVSLNSVSPSTGGSENSSQSASTKSSVAESLKKSVQASSAKKTESSACSNCESGVANSSYFRPQPLRPMPQPTPFVSRYCYISPNYVSPIKHHIKYG